MRIKILHIAAGLSSGGVAEVVAMLAMYQRKLGCDVTMASVAAEDDEVSDSVRRAVGEGVKLVQFRSSFPHALFFSWQMLTGLNALIKEADVVHVHSNWTFPVWWGCMLALKNNKKLVMTPHGCLSPERLMHSRWKKKAVGALDRHFLRRATVIHATCEAEAFSIKDFIEKASASQRLSRRVAPGLSRSEAAGSNGLRPGLSRRVAPGLSRSEAAGLNGLRPGLIAAAPLVQKSSSGTEETNELMNYRTNELPTVLVLPNGVELDEFDGEIDHEFWQKRYPEIGDRKVILALGRLHPLKGLDLLISAWAAITAGLNAHSTSHVPHPTFNNFQLVIAGPDEQGTLEQLKSQVNKLNLTEHVLFPGAISAAERRDAIGSAQYLVLSSRHENFGLTVVEALASRVPVIATKGSPWAALSGCGRAAGLSRSEAAGLSRPAGAGLSRSEAAGLSGPAGAGLSRSEAAGLRFKVDAAGAAGLRSDGYCDHGASYAKAPAPMVVAKRSVKEQQARSSCCTASKAINSSFITHPSSLATSGRAGWWVDVSVAPLAAALREAMELSAEERAAMGENGRALVEAKYQWSLIVEQMLEVYAASPLV